MNRPRTAAGASVRQGGLAKGSHDVGRSAAAALRDTASAESGRERNGDTLPNANTSTPPNPEARLAELGIELLPEVPPLGSYIGAVQCGSLLFCSGHLPDLTANPGYLGKLGRDVTTAQGYAAARHATISLLSTARATLGDLDHVARVVKLFGMVNSTEEFTDQPRVIDGASDLLREVFADRAPHARTAVGMAQLPRGACVEIEAVLEINTPS